MSESMSYNSGSYTAADRANDERRLRAERERLLAPYKKRIEELEATHLTTAEARAVLEKLNGNGEMSLDYLHAREKLKTLVE